MNHLKLQEKQKIPLPKDTFLCLEYYLVETSISSYFVYGIRIQAYHMTIPHSTIYAEEVSMLSYSQKEVISLISQCIQHQVTPTDLFSSLDILMNLS